MPGRPREHLAGSLESLRGEEQLQKPFERLRVPRRDPGPALCAVEGLVGLAPLLVERGQARERRHVLGIFPQGELVLREGQARLACLLA